MILLTGASGKTGKALLKALSKSESICALVHHQEHVSIMMSLGAEKVIVGDMRDFTAIRSAIDGASAIYHICPNMSPDEMIISKLVIEAAKRAGVRLFVYHSVLHPQTEKMTHHWQKLRVEEMLFESDLPFTILQPAPYMQNLLTGWQSIVAEGILRVPYSVHSKFSFIDIEDLAEAAKIVLTEPGHSNSIYELAGTPPMSHVAAANIFERALNRPVRAEREQIRDWRSRVNALSEYALENLTKMFEYYDQWGLVGNPNVLRWLLKREPTTLEQFIERTVKENESSPL
jgi:uncharacterized protein YbjT (DUF2867 family)